MAKTADEIREILQRQAARRRLAEQWAQEYAGCIVLRHDDSSNSARPWSGAVIHPSTRNPGRWQVTIFDADGFAYDYSEPTQSDAIFEAMRSGHDTIDMGLLDRVGETPRFMAGVLWSQLPDSVKWRSSPREIQRELESKTAP